MSQEPLCPYFGRCGGCATQHIEYALQLENKRQQLLRATGFEALRVFSGEPYGYRNRMDMVFHKTGLGFRKKGEWKAIVPVSRCVISNTRLNDLITEINTFFGSDIDAFDVVKRTGTFCYAIVRTPGQDSCVNFVLNKDSTRVGEAITKIEAFARKTSAANVLVVHIDSKSGDALSDDYFVVKGGDRLFTTILGKTFECSAQGFFQNNDAMAEQMHAYVRGLFGAYDTAGSHLLDLYGGVGTFGILNADLFKAVTTVESFEGCTQSAVRNIAANGAANVRAVCLDAKRLKTLAFPQSLFVITDPPRSGMHPKTIEQLNVLAPQTMVYISCNIQELAKDLPKFKDYKIKSAAVFDLFPQTNHMESVVELVRK